MGTVAMINATKLQGNRTILVLVMMVASLMLFSNISCHKDQKTKIGITQIVSHPSLDEIRKGIIQGLAERGYVDGKNIEIIYRNANGDPSLTLPIAQDFVQKGVKVLVPITTPSALGAAKSTQTIPIIFGAVTDPLRIGLVKDLNRPGGNISGTSDRWPIEKQIQLIMKILPNMKRLGMIYRPGDDVSKLGADTVKALSTKLNFQLVLIPCSDPGQMYTTVLSLMREVDAVYTGMDNLVVENLEAILKASRETQKPVFSGDTESVERGALATVALRMFDIGKETGHMVADVLGGKKPADMPVRIITEGEPVANAAAVKEYGISPDLMKQLGVRLVGPIPN